MDFQFLHLLDPSFDNFSKKGNFLKHFVNISGLYYGAPSFRDVVCYKLLYKIKGSDDDLEKSEEIFEDLKKKFEFGKQVLDVNWRIERIQTLINSLKLFCNFEMGEEKKQLEEQMEMFEKILTFLKSQKENGVTALKLLIEKFGCPLNIKALFFWDLFFEEIFSALGV